MPNRWNPSNPDIAGDEWFGSAAKLEPITQQTGRGPIITATATESVDLVSTILRATGGGSGILVCDVYDLAATIFDVPTQVICRPGANFSNADGWQKSNSGTITNYAADAYINVRDIIGTEQAISTGAQSQLVFGGVNSGLVDQILFSGDNSAFYDGQTGASGAAITSRRIVGVDVIAIVEGSPTTPVRLDGYLNLGGTRYGSGSPQIINQGAGLTRMVWSFPWHPGTGRPWLQSDRISLTNGSDAFGIGIVTKNNLGYFVVTSVLLQFHTVPERRVVTGYASGPPNGTAAWRAFGLVSPVDGTTLAWTKTSGHRYLALFSQALNTQPLSLIALDTSLTRGHEADQLSGTTAAQVSLNPGGSTVNAVLNESTAAINVLLSSASVARAETQPYADAPLFRIGVDDGFATATQRVSTESAQLYGTARVVCGVDSDGAGGRLQTAPLNVSLIRVSDSAVLGGPIPIAPADIPTDGKYHVVNVRFASSVSLTAAQPVYIQVATTQTGQGTGWRLPVLFAFAPGMDAADAFSVVAAAQGIGGTADSTGATTGDWPWSIGVVPPAPTGLTVATATIANRPVLAHSPTSGKSPTTIGYVHLSWNATSVGAKFGWYEVQRQQGTTWYPIAFVTTEASNYFNDIEGPRGIAGHTVARAYRMRTVRSDGGYSDWATFGAVNVTVENHADLVLSSNHSPADALAFKDLGGTHAWDQLQTARGKVQPILGRDMPVAFYPAESAGEAFTRKLAVAYNDSAVVEGGAVTPDHAVFAPVLALLQNRALPNISYADAWGNVWFTSPAIQSPGPTRDEPNGQYFVPVIFTQVDVGPDPVTIGTPAVLA